MNPPCDYAAEDSLDRSPNAGTPPPSPVADDSPLTVAALFDRHEAQLPITEAMIADACRTLHAAGS